MVCIPGVPATAGPGIPLLQPGRTGGGGIDGYRPFGTSEPLPGRKQGRLRGSIQYPVSGRTFRRGFFELEKETFSRFWRMNFPALSFSGIFFSFFVRIDRSYTGGWAFLGMIFCISFIYVPLRS